MNDKLKKIVYNSWIELTARWFLGIVFIYASYHKMIEPAEFAKIIYGYQLFPDFSINLIAILMPYIEFFCGISLILGIYTESAALIINGMTVSFIVVLSINLIRGHQFDCGCFTLEEHTAAPYLTAQWIVRDILYLVIGLHVFFYHKHRRWCILKS